ncbi:hypothetical protein B1218_35465, partial [Pseudomonas ogarae]
IGARRKRGGGSNIAGGGPDRAGRRVRSGNGGGGGGRRGYVGSKRCDDAGAWNVGACGSSRVGVGRRMVAIGGGKESGRAGGACGG